MEDDEIKDRAFGSSDSASRARNRTVLLSPETVGQVRHILEEDVNTVAEGQIENLLPPLNWGEPESVTVEPPSEPLPPPPSQHSFQQFEQSKPVAQPSPIHQFEQPKPVAQPSPIQQFEQPKPVAQPSPIHQLISNEPPQFHQAPKVVRPASVTTIQERPIHQVTMPQPSQMGHNNNTNVGSKEPTMSSAIRPQPRNLDEQQTQNVVKAVIQKQAPKTKLLGFLVSYDANALGDVYEIRAGRWVISSRATTSSEYILIEDETISPLHAIVRGTPQGAVQILDQLSEFGTAVIRNGSDAEEEVVASMITVAHGDVVRFGKRYFTVCMIPERVTPKPNAPAEQPEPIENGEG